MEKVVPNSSKNRDKRGISSKWLSKWLSKPVISELTVNILFLFLISYSKSYIKIISDIYFCYFDEVLKPEYMENCL